MKSDTFQNIILRLIGGIRIIPKTQHDGVVLWTARGNCLTPPDLYKYVGVYEHPDGSKLYRYVRYSLRERFGNHFFRVDNASYLVSWRRDMSEGEVRQYAQEHGFVITP